MVKNINILKKSLILISCIVSVFLITGCGKQAVTETTPSPEPTATVSYAGKICITEIMPKNKATVRDLNGEFTDWIEIENFSQESINLKGWKIGTGKDDVSLDGTTLEPGQILLVYAAVENNGTTTLYDENGNKADFWNLPDIKADRSAVKNEEGTITECIYPTPGKENTVENYDLLQADYNSAGPLEIYEVCVEDFSYHDWDYIGYSDWVEIRNNSDKEVNTKGWYLTDDLKDAFKYNLGDHTLSPGEIRLIPCDKDATAEEIYMFNFATFSLDSDNDRIYLISPEGELADFTPLKGIPYGMTFGRRDNEKGFFYLDASPEKSNSTSSQKARRVCPTPELISKDGIFNNVGRVEVVLESDYDIYFTTDGSAPTEDSQLYKGPFYVSETSIVKAIAVGDDVIKSRPLVLSYIINQKNSLPVVSVVADNYTEFERVYDNGYKYAELPGTISYYGPDGKFTIGAGIKLHGFSTLRLQKKNMSFKFRGCYGSDELVYDIFGDGADGGVTHFSDILLRAGGDQNNTIVKNEALLALGMEFSDNIYCSRFKYVAVYVDGKYKGIYALMDKNNEAWFAKSQEVNKDSVTITEDPAYSSDPYYKDVLDIVFFEDVRDSKVYERVCKVLDIDSLIDWTILEGFSGNWDLESGNLKYVKSTETDGKWKLILYDLDNALYSGDNCFAYVLNSYNQVSALNSKLLRNSEYREKFLERSSYALKNVVTKENLWKHYQELAAIIDEEAKIDSTISYDSWKRHLDDQKDILFKDFDWYNDCVSGIATGAHLSSEEAEKWFGVN